MNSNIGHKNTTDAVRFCKYKNYDYKKMGYFKPIVEYKIARAENFVEDGKIDARRD